MRRAARRGRRQAWRRRCIRPRSSSWTRARRRRVRRRGRWRRPVPPQSAPRIRSCSKLFRGQLCQQVLRPRRCDRDGAGGPMPAALLDSCDRPGAPSPMTSNGAREPARRPDRGSAKSSEPVRMRLAHRQHDRYEHAGRRRSVNLDATSTPSLGRSGLDAAKEGAPRQGTAPRTAERRSGHGVGSAGDSASLSRTGLSRSAMRDRLRRTREPRCWSSATAPRTDQARRAVPRRTRRSPSLRSGIACATPAGKLHGNSFERERISGAELGGLDGAIDLGDGRDRLDALVDELDRGRIHRRRASARADVLDAPALTCATRCAHNAGDGAQPTASERIAPRPAG